MNGRSVCVQVGIGKRCFNTILNSLDTSLAPRFINSLVSCFSFIRSEVVFFLNEASFRNFLQCLREECTDIKGSAFRASSFGTKIVETVEINPHM